MIDDKDLWCVTPMSKGNYLTHKKSINIFGQDLKTI